MTDIRHRYLDDDDADRVYAVYPKLANPDWCPTCKGKKVYRWRGEEHDCDCQMQRQLMKHYANAGVNERYMRLDWDDFHGDQDALKSVRGYLAESDDLTDDGIGLLFLGPNGIGKTMLATLVLKELVKRRVDCWTTTFARTIDRLTDTWGTNEDARREGQWFRRKFESSEVVLLDDIGKELRRNTTNLPEATFDSVLRHRVNTCKATLITTNMTIEELGVGYGGSVLDLMREVCIPVTVDGASYRDQAIKRAMGERQVRERRPIA